MQNAFTNIVYICGLKRMSNTIYVGEVVYQFSYQLINLLDISDNIRENDDDHDSWSRIYLQAKFDAYEWIELNWIKN